MEKCFKPNKILLNFLIIVLFFLWGVVHAISQKTICSNQYIKNEKNIRTIYLNYKFKGKRCLSWKAYFQLGQRAYIGGKLKEALWSVNLGLQNLSKKQGILVAKFKSLKGSILREMNRFEEAIIILREVVFEDNVPDSKTMIKEKSHLQLIQTYYAKTEFKTSQDVAYLITLFRNRYPKSKYLKLLQNWQSKK